MAVRTIPILPCPSIDEVTDFYEALGFATTYRQVRPNPYIVVERDGLELHYSGIDGFDPANSYGTCAVMVDDTEPWFDALAVGLRGRYGKLPLTGIPRITRPRRRRNAGGLSGFSLIDPGGNWVRFMRDAAASRPQTTPTIAETQAAAAGESRLATAYANAVVLADSHGDPAQAVKILGGAIRRDNDASPVADRVQALAYLAELHVRTDDPESAVTTLALLEGQPLTPEVEDAVADLRRGLSTAG